MAERVSAYRKTREEVDSIFDALGQPKIDSYTGDKIWLSFFEEKSPFDEDPAKFILALSPLGEKTFGGEIRVFVKAMESGKFEPKIRDFNTLTGLRGVVKRARIGGFLNPIQVYIKTLRPIAGTGLDVTGIEQFTAMRLLEVNGIQVASPLLATRYRLVTREVVGLPANENSTTFRNYLRILKGLREKLISQGLWNEEWQIEKQPSNYLQTLWGVVAIDPIFRKSVFIW